MKMLKLLDCVYSVRQADLPNTKEFIREDPKNGEIQPLLHICERDIDPTQTIKTVIVVADVVRWDFYYGYYKCQGCKSTWQQPVNLRKIWEDGYGTGDEVHT